MAEDTYNPYATPKAVVADAGASEAEAIRREHITREAEVKSVGYLFILGGFLSLVGAAGFVISSLQHITERPGFVAIGILIGGFAVGYVAVGWGVRGLRPWSRIPAIVLAAIGLLGFPIGTLINAYILWLLASRKGKRVLTADYAAIIEATPHIRYRTSRTAWIALLVIILILVALFVLPTL